MSKSRPILFKSEMIRKILSGEKTMTRRIVNPRPTAYVSRIDQLLTGVFADVISHEDNGIRLVALGTRRQCPFGVKNDLLWIRESWRVERFYDHHSPCDLPKSACLWWDADNSSLRALNAKPGKCRSSIHMPKWASRITLRITSVKVERLQDISEEDAAADGGFAWNNPDTPTDGYLPHDFNPEDCSIPGEDPYDDYWPAVRCFHRLWDSINGKREGCDWASNPFCWCITFERVKEAN